MNREGARDFATSLQKTHCAVAPVIDYTDASPKAFHYERLRSTRQRRSHDGLRLWTDETDAYVRLPAVGMSLSFLTKRNSARR